MFSWLGVLKPLVLRIYWPSNERIARVTAPILFICGTKDDLVPPTHSKDLYALANKAKGTCLCPLRYCRPVPSRLAIMVLPPHPPPPPIVTPSLPMTSPARVMYEVEGAGHNDCGPKGGVPYILQFSSFVMRHTAR